jgi:hypothetical protein
MQQGESTHDRVRRLRALNEGEKLSLIFTQQRRLGEFEERIEAFQCAHDTGAGSARKILSGSVFNELRLPRLTQFDYILFL